MTYTLDFVIEYLYFKKDISNELDMDDKLRIYQYPLENKFKVSYIEEKKWKRLSVEI